MSVKEKTIATKELQQKMFKSIGGVHWCWMAFSDIVALSGDERLSKYVLVSLSNSSTDASVDASSIAKGASRNQHQTTPVSALTGLIPFLASNGIVCRNLKCYANQYPEVDHQRLNLLC